MENHVNNQNSSVSSSNKSNAVTLTKLKISFEQLIFVFVSLPITDELVSNSSVFPGSRHSSLLLETPCFLAPVL